MTLYATEWTQGVLMRVAAERWQQDQTWGPATERGHEPEEWLTILAEEVGEVARAILDYRYGGNPASAREQIERESIQVAAVAVALVESLRAGAVAEPPEEESK